MLALEHLKPQMGSRWQRWWIVCDSCILVERSFVWPPTLPWPRNVSPERHPENIKTKDPVPTRHFKFIKKELLTAMARQSKATTATRAVSPQQGTKRDHLGDEESTRRVAQRAEAPNEETAEPTTKQLLLRDSLNNKRSVMQLNSGFTPVQGQKYDHSNNKKRVAQRAEAPNEETAEPTTKQLLLRDSLNNKRSVMQLNSGFTPVQGQKYDHSNNKKIRENAGERRA